MRTMVSIEMILFPNDPLSPNLGAQDLYQNALAGSLIDEVWTRQNRLKSSSTIPLPYHKSLLKDIGMTSHCIR